MKDKVLLTDCDGVVLDWEYHFTAWMKDKGYEIVNPEAYNIGVRYGIGDDYKPLVRAFNESAWVGKMAPFRDAIKYVKKLHEEHGFVFHAITSLSHDKAAQELRTQNLKDLFGTAFQEFIYLDTGGDKDEELAKYADTGCLWVEDKPKNADLGFDLGLEAVLIAHDHNSDYTGPAHRVQNWKQIYEFVTH